MTETQFTLKAEKRDVFGKKLKPLRAAGKIPAVLYGAKNKSEPLAVEEADFKKILPKISESDFIKLNIENKQKEVFIKEIQTEPVSGALLHIDFYLPSLEKPIETKVKINFIGSSPAVKAGGVLIRVKHELPVKGLPKEIPREFIIDLAKLVNIGDHIFCRDMETPANIQILAKPEDVIAVVREQIKEEEAAAPAPDLSTIEVIKKKPKEEVIEEEETKTETKKEAKK